jgi:hypothetical protein
MIRRLTLAFCLSLLILAPGCRGADPVVGTPITGQPDRTYASMLPFIKKTLTAPSAELVFGAPDQAIGGGSVLFIYNVENGQKVNLNFPSPTDPISFANLQDKNGGTTPIPLGN